MSEEHRFEAKLLDVLRDIANSLRVIAVREDEHLHGTGASEFEYKTY